MKKSKKVSKPVEEKKEFPEQAVEEALDKKQRGKTGIVIREIPVEIVEDITITSKNGEKFESVKIMAADKTLEGELSYWELDPNTKIIPHRSWVAGKFLNKKTGKQPAPNVGEFWVIDVQVHGNNNGDGAVFLLAFPQRLLTPKE